MCGQNPKCVYRDDHQGKCFIEQNGKPTTPEEILDGYYNRHPSGVECITIAQHYNFNLGNVIKYVWRAGLKTDKPIEDLKKAKQYIEYEIARLS